MVLARFQLQNQTHSSLRAQSSQLAKSWSGAEERGGEEEGVRENFNDGLFSTARTVAQDGDFVERTKRYGGGWALTVSGIVVASTLDI